MYLDSDVIFALLKPNDRHILFATSIIKSNQKLYTSSVTLIELEIVIKRELSDFLSKNVLELVMEKVPNLKIMPFGKETMGKSLGLRKKYGLGVFDSIHAASALSKDRQIASTDQIFDKVNGLKRIKPQQ